MSKDICASITDFEPMDLSNKDEVGSLYSIDLHNDESLATVSFVDWTKEGDTPLHQACNVDDATKIQKVLREFNKTLIGSCKEREQQLRSFINTENRAGKRALHLLLPRVYLERIVQTNLEQRKQDRASFVLLLRGYPEITEDIFSDALHHCDESICLDLIDAGADKLIATFTNREDKYPDDLVCEQHLTPFFEVVLAKVCARNSSGINMVRLEEYLMKMKTDAMTFPMLYARDGDWKRFQNYYWGHRTQQVGGLIRNFLGNLLNTSQKNDSYICKEITCKDKNGCSALWYAAGANCTEISRCCLAMMTISSAFPYRFTQNPLVHAAERGSVDVLKLFFALGESNQSILARVSRQCLQNRSRASCVTTCIPEAFLIACEQGQLAAVEAFVEQYPHLIHVVKNRRGPISTGVICAAGGSQGTGHVNVCKYLIEKGSNVNTKVRERTALYRAAKYGNRELCRLLLDNNADPKVMCEGRSPLMVAAFGGYWGVCEELIWHNFVPALRPSKASPDILDAQDKQGNTALMYAAANGQVDVYIRLLKMGANQNIQRKRDGMTALMILAHREGTPEAHAAYEKIITCGTDVKHLRKALIIAAKRGNQPFVKALINREPNIADAAYEVAKASPSMGVIDFLDNYLRDIDPYGNKIRHVLAAVSRQLKIVPSQEEIEDILTDDEVNTDI
jgi:ankyrin repeat protein